MSDEVLPYTSNGIADAITADLSTADQAPAPATEAPVAAAETPLEPAAATPAAETQEQPPTPLKLTDKSLVEDPANPGELKPWGEIKAERLRWKDYTQKRMAEAETLRQYEANEKLRQAEYEAWKTKQQIGTEDVLPTDDPYALRIRALEAKQEAALAQQSMQAQTLQQERFAAARARLDAEEARVTSEYKLNEREMDIVGRDLLARMGRQEQATLADVAKEFAEYRESIRAAGLKEWQEKHRVGSPAAAVAVPAAGTPNDIPVPGTRAFEDRMREEFAAIR